eukprot:COSAG04_NODE_2720_length_3682_cov_1.276026_2_plen_188_part_00
MADHYRAANGDLSLRTSTTMTVVQSVSFLGYYTDDWDDRASNTGRRLPEWHACQGRGLRPSRGAGSLCGLALSNLWEVKRRWRGPQAFSFPSFFFLNREIARNFPSCRLGPRGPRTPSQPRPPPSRATTRYRTDYLAAPPKMRVIAVGCEYSGVTTLLSALDEWGTSRGIHFHRGKPPAPAPRRPGA